MEKPPAFHTGGIVPPGTLANFDYPCSVVRADALYESVEIVGRGRVAVVLRLDPKVLAAHRRER